MVDQSGTTDQQERKDTGRTMCQDPAIRRLLKIAVAFVMLSLWFANLHGGHWPPAGTLSQQRFVHGWPAIWLYRAWRYPPYARSYVFETALQYHPWPWVELPGEVRDYVPWAMFVDAAVAAVILFAVMRGLGLRPGGRRFRADAATAVALLSFFALPTLLATYLPGTLTFLANAGVFFAVVFAGYTVLACVFRWILRGGGDGMEGSVEDRGNSRA